MTRRPHPSSAPGDFYCDADACLRCGAMPLEAPELIATDADGSCFVKRQPSSDEELYRMVRAMSVNEVEGLRYAGDDPDVLERIASAELSGCCDRTGTRPCHRRRAWATTTRALLSCAASGVETQRAVADRLRAALPRSVHVVGAGATLWFWVRRWLRSDWPDEGAAIAVLGGDPRRAGIVVAVPCASDYPHVRLIALVDDVLRDALRHAGDVSGVGGVRWFTDAEWRDPAACGRLFPL